MDKYDLAIAVDENAIRMFGRNLAQSGVPKSRVDDLQEYCRLSLMPRDNDDPLDPSECDWSLFSRMENLRERLDRGLVSRADQFLQEWVSQGSRHKTINGRLDEFIHLPTGLPEPVPAQVFVPELDELWLQANIRPENVPGVCQWMQ
jgi:hypothetical protein